MNKRIFLLSSTMLALVAASLSADESAADPQTPFLVDQDEAGTKTVQPATDSNHVEVGNPILSKLPYVNRLFKNAGVGGPLRGETVVAPKPICQDNPNCKSEQILGVPTLDAGCRSGACFGYPNTGTLALPATGAYPKYANKCTSSPPAKGCSVGEACGFGSTWTIECKGEACACGESCKCSGKTKTNPVRWFSFHGPRVTLPSYATCPASGPVATGPPQLLYSAPARSQYPAPPSSHDAHFGAVHKQLVEALTENAKLKAREESRQEFLGEFVQTAVENGELKAKLEAAEQRTELLQAVLEMQQEHAEELAKAKAANVQLEAQVELLGERQELLEDYAEVQGEIAEKMAEIQVHSARLELQQQAIEKVQAENQALKARVAELLQERNSERTAVRPSTETRDE